MYVKIITSYFAKVDTLKQHCIVPVSIARFQPKWLIGDNALPVVDCLAPTKDILRDRKQFGLSDAQYTARFYNEVLSKLDATVIASQLTEYSKRYGNNWTIALCCYERPGQFCHRRLVAEWLQRELGIEVPEFIEPVELSINDEDDEDNTIQ